MVLYTELFYAISCLLCFHTFCCSVIPTSPYILNVCGGGGGGGGGGALGSPPPPKNLKRFDDIINYLCIMAVGINMPLWLL